MIWWSDGLWWNGRSLQWHTSPTWIDSLVVVDNCLSAETSFSLRGNPYSIKSTSSASDMTIMGLRNFSHCQSLIKRRILPLSSVILMPCTPTFGKWSFVSKIRWSFEMAGKCCKTGLWLTVQIQHRFYEDQLLKLCPLNITKSSLVTLAHSRGKRDMVLMSECRSLLLAVGSFV